VAERGVSRLDRRFTIRNAVPEAAVLENSVDVQSPPEEVFDYCTDLGREHEWNPKLRRAEKLTADSIGRGTRFQAEFLKGRSDGDRVRGLSTGRGPGSQLAARVASMRGRSAVWARSVVARG
jgi:hypothetical protein